MGKVEITYRGWPGHFIGARHCVFRLNTLVELGDQRVVISTVGGNLPMSTREMPGGNPIGQSYIPIGADRHYETMVFVATWDGHYWDADVQLQLEFDGAWSVSDPNGDSEANDNHERIVAEFAKRLEGGEIFS